MIKLFRQFVEEVKEVYRFRYVVMAFTDIKLKHRYRRSFLGYIWTVFTPLINYLIMGIVISFIARAALIENYYFYFLSSSIFFGFISNVISNSFGCLISNEHFIKKIYFPKSIFFINVVALDAINFFLAFVTLYCFALVFGMEVPQWTAVISLLTVVISFPFVFGLGIIVGIGVIFFRDLLHIIPAILQALYFLTPILYSPTMIPEQYRSYVYLNPLYYFVECFRAPLMPSQEFHWKYLLICAALSVSMMVFGFWLLKKMENKIVFKL